MLHEIWHMVELKQHYPKMCQTPPCQKKPWDHNRPSLVKRYARFYTQAADFHHFEHKNVVEAEAPISSLANDLSGYLTKLRRTVKAVEHNVLCTPLGPEITPQHP